MYQLNEWKQKTVNVSQNKNAQLTCFILWCSSVHDVRIALNGFVICQRGYENFKPVLVLEYSAHLHTFMLLNILFLLTL